MKKLENKKIVLKDKETSYADIILIGMEVVPEKGWSSKSMAQALKIEVNLTSNKDSDVIEIEDADMVYIKEIFKNFKWSIKAKEIVEFNEYLESIK